MEETVRERRWFWMTLVLSSISIVALVFAFWELVENRFFRELNYVSLHYLYISRGIASSLLLASWAAWFVLRQRRIAEEELRRSRERYRGLLEASPEAVALYDANLNVWEWNATAERLYGFSKAQVLGGKLPTVPGERSVELENFLRRVQAGESVLDQETVRCNRDGASLDVQLSLLPFREGAQTYFLEVTSDIRERVRLRQRLIELEKLTSMGQMAAGTAHHLNTPLASMLLRVQMMRERTAEGAMAADLERLEQSIGFCQQFVRRLLDFSRRPALQKQPEEISSMMEAVLGFLAPSVTARKARLTCEMRELHQQRVLADRNQMETVLLILLSNALDAISPGGQVRIAGSRPAAEMVEIAIVDDGCGIAEADLANLFEPFFTTKPPGKGTGLGLAIARSIVREHGGTLRLEGKPGQGARAILQLPACLAAPRLEEVAP